MGKAEASADRPPLVAVLAAGRASRFGGGKLDAMCAGKRVGQWVLDAVAEAGLRPGVIVVGGEIPAFAETSDWTLLVNDKVEDGLGTSLALVARQAWEGDCPLLVLLADMPLVTSGHIASLAKAHSATATAWPDGHAGVPALFPPVYLPELAALSGDEGAGGLLREISDKAVIAANPSTLIDIDTPRELSRAEAVLLNRG